MLKFQTQFPKLDMAAKCVFKFNGALIPKNLLVHRWPDLKYLIFRMEDIHQYTGFQI